jgi:hypothetical protein
MEAKIVKKDAPGRGQVDILAETYESGEPRGRDEQLKYLKSAERYWYSSDWFGSEKRKNPA